MFVTTMAAVSHVSDHDAWSLIDSLLFDSAVMTEYLATTTAIITVFTRIDTYYMLLATCCCFLIFLSHDGDN